MVFQEMWCPECKFYMGFHLELEYSGIVKVICGVCKHEHQRRVKEGRIVEEGRYNHGEPVMDIVVLKSQCHPESRVEAMRKAQEDRKGYHQERNAHLGEEQEVARPLTSDEAQRAAMMSELWSDYHGGGPH